GKFLPGGRHRHTHRYPGSAQPPGGPVESSGEAMSITMVIAGATVALLVAAAVRTARRRARRPVPEARIAGEPRELARSPRYAAQRLRILVVDDNPFIGDAVARLLREHDVTTAVGGEVALARLANDTGFDAILVAFAMPGMSGAAFAAQLAE